MKKKDEWDIENITISKKISKYFLDLLCVICNIDGYKLRKEKVLVYTPLHNLLRINPEEVHNNRDEILKKISRRLSNKPWITN